MISFRVHGIPKPQPRPRAFARKFGDKWAARVFDAGTAESFKSAIAIAARDLRPPTPLDGPIKISVSLYFPRPKAHFRANGQLKPNAPKHHTSKPDCENVLKACLDCLTQLGFWRDDSQICDEQTTKQYSDDPGAWIEISPIESEVTQ